MSTSWFPTYPTCLRWREDSNIAGPGPSQRPQLPGPLQSYPQLCPPFFAPACGLPGTIPNGTTASACKPRPSAVEPRTRTRTSTSSLRSCVDCTRRWFRVRPARTRSRNTRRCKCCSDKHALSIDQGEAESSNVEAEKRSRRRRGSRPRSTKDRRKRLGVEAVATDEIDWSWAVLDSPWQCLFCTTL